uniref:JmjC domain-containing protein n=2 Tax=Phaeomonas parva TaxID=124430 RepID=A0A6U4EFU0_9STRA|mmetsp:Transcript_20368/g.61862  ORF Transcript_20368/g.61862 Transcript_20368/m.61862 type:complete len:646 (+) Transcript_20368:321-2258(+)
MGSMKYIESIREEAEKYGICKIIPPQGWNPPCAVDRQSTKAFRTRIQDIHGLQQGGGFDHGEKNARSYAQRARDFKEFWVHRKYRGDNEGRRELSYASLEEDYWRVVETGCDTVQVEYGNDLSSKVYWSGFEISEDPPKPQEMDLDVDFSNPDYYKKTSWNTNNFPRSEGSVLRHFRAEIDGVNVPWLYFGMLFSSFCWHNEDNYMYSVNYHHFGEPKQWYGAPGTAADKFEDAMKAFLKERFDKTPDLLHHMTTQLSPSLLQASGVPVCRTVQHAGEFVVTFPKAFHGGFSYGFNCGEAVNFAPPEWIEYGREAALRYRIYARPSVLSHDRVLLLLAYNLEGLALKAANILLGELQRLKNEEEELRPWLYSMGVRDVSDQVSLPPNRLDFIDSVSADYDEKRCCTVCRHICFLSAIACNCSRKKVACLHHEAYMCQCPKQEKFMLCWASIADMEKNIARVRTHIHNLLNPDQKLPLPALEAMSGRRSSPKKRPRPGRGSPPRKKLPKPASQATESESETTQAPRSVAVKSESREQRADQTRVTENPSIPPPPQAAPPAASPAPATDAGASSDSTCMPCSSSSPPPPANLADDPKVSEAKAEPNPPAPPAGPVASSSSKTVVDSSASNKPSVSENLPAAVQAKSS